MTACTTKIVNTQSEFHQLKNEWNELNHQSASDNLFLTYDWIECWLNFMPANCTLFIIMVYRDDKLIGIAPFYKVPVRILWLLRSKVLRIIADQNSSAEYQDLILHPDYANLAISHIAREIVRSADDCLGIWIPYCDDANGSTERLKQVLTEAQYSINSRKIEFYRINLPKKHDQFDAMLGTKQRNNIRRYQKKLAAKNNLEMVNLADTMSPIEAFSILETLHAQRWRARGEPGAFERHPAFRDFMRTYTQKAAETDQLSAYCLLQDNKPIAIRFGFNYKNTLYEIQSGFDPSLNGAGIVAIDMAIKSAITKGIETYDFLAFEGDYKQRFGAIEQPGTRLFALKKSILGRIISRLNLWPTGRYLQL